MSGMLRILATCLAINCATHALRAADEPTGEPKTFRFSTARRDTIRSIPTTQVEIRVDEWPGQTFLLWCPEAVAPIGSNSSADFARQEFTEADNGGLRWEHTPGGKARVVAIVTPRADSLLVEVAVTNLTDQPLEQVSAQNCFHLSAAPDFACDDFSRVHLRKDGEWQTLKQLQPSVSMPMYYREGFLEAGRSDSWGGVFKAYNQAARVDHPLMVCTSRDGTRAVATASEDYQCVFHNQLEYLRCIHSQQAPVPVLKPDETVVFRQVIYFIEGGVDECVRAFVRDFEGDRLRQSANE